MLSGGRIVIGGFDIGEEASVLGMESRSILKSIQTEEAKLVQSNHLTRSDLHYFRARHNYYRLSLLRLPSEERSVLEPVLGRFFERILNFEERDESALERSPAPFLQTVERPPPSRSLTMVTPGSSNPRAADPLPGMPSISSSTLLEVVSQLQLVRLALGGDFGPDGKKILIEGMDRVLQKLKSS